MGAKKTPEYAEYEQGKNTVTAVEMLIHIFRNFNTIPGVTNQYHDSPVKYSYWQVPDQVALLISHWFSISYSNLDV